MRKTFILLSLLAFALTANASAQKVLTAKQLFMLLPNEYVSGTAAERAENLIFPQSIKPDFLTFAITGKSVPQSLAGDFQEPEGIGNVRVFRGKSSVIVAVRYQIGDGKTENPTVDSVNLTTILLEYKGKKWMNVTDALMPRVSADYAYRVLTEDFKMNVKKEDVWVEAAQIFNEKNGLQIVGRIKGDDSATTLKFFKWDGIKFVESEN